MRIVNGAVFCPDGRFHTMDVAAEGGVFTREGGGPALDAAGCYVIPGLVDIHTHGAMGADASDGDAAGLETMSRWYAAHGTTSFLATTMTLQEPVLRRAMEAVRDFRPPEDGACCAGVHLEGPFVCYEKRGAQAAENLHAPDEAMFRRLDEASGGRIRLITLAPEVDGALPFIRAVSPRCAVSLGHTCADYETARAAYAAGADHATHLFNAMNGLHHRKPGVIGAAMDSGAWTELICDGLHIHPSVVRAAWRMFGQRLVLISDSLRCAGMPDGDYELGGQPIVMRGGRATLLDGTLAGSSICLLDAVRNCVEFGLPLEDAVRAATASPARAARLDGQVGSIEPGKRADCLLLDRDLTLRQVVIGGKPLL